MKVLIIDDHDMNVTLLKNLMMAKVPDCETFCYTKSAEALIWCEENDPDLVLVDYMMPSPNGLEFIERFRKLAGKGDIPVVMITAVNEKDIRLKAIEFGANDFINKPIDTAELTARVRNMLALRKSQKALSNRAEWLAEEVRKATHEIVEREREVILRLTRAAEYRDPETGMHIVRMAQYCKLIAKAIGLSMDEQDLILDASPMHDIGKVGIADFILLKGEHLSTDEFESMKKHTTRFCRAVNPNFFKWRSASPYIIMKNLTAPVTLTAYVIMIFHWPPAFVH